MGFVGRWEGFHSKSFSLAHVLLLIVTVTISIGLAFLLRKVEHKKIHKTIKVFACIMLFSDIIKWIWDFSVLGKFSFEKSFPFYICSLIIYVLPFVAFGKGKVQRACLACLSTICIVGGFFGILFNVTVTQFPFFHLNVLNSFLYHGIMLFISFWMWFSKVYVPNIKDTYMFYIPFLVFSIPVLILDLCFGWDYMFFNGGIDTPFNIVFRAVPHPVYIILLYLGLYIINILIFYIPTITRYFKNKKSQQPKETVE